jgi:tetratricopeptide (TPR) repeat protein
LENAVTVALDVIARGERRSNDDDFVNEVLARLAEMTKAGRFDAGAAEVDGALAELDRREEEQRHAFRRQRETLLEAGVEQDILRRDAFAVTRRIEAIVALDAPDGHPAWSPKYDDRIRAFYSEGTEKGVNFSLEVAAELARRMLAAARYADQRTASLNWLGNALFRLGERESGTARLEEAVAAYREALQERIRDRVPLDWAMTQNNLGNALQALGARESGTARLEKAVAAYGEALKEWTRERDPSKWSVTQNNLGAALRALGERESGTARLEEAVAAHREALKERIFERVSLDWAMTQNNLGAALFRLGERESGTARLEEAVDAFHEALRERTRTRVPRDWANTQNNLGAALQELGERENGTARLEEAVAAYREALQERSAARKYPRPRPA